MSYENIKEYKGLEVRRESMGSGPTNSARYEDGVVTLYDYFYTFTLNKQKAVLEHEFSHHIWFKFIPRKYQIFWGTISKTIRLYISGHAKTNLKEDFSECIEAWSLIEDGELEKPSGLLLLKLNIAKTLYNKFIYVGISNLLTEKYNGKAIDYDGVYGHQCVDLVKQYSAEFLLQPLGTFGGSAKTGWENKSNTFPEDIWDRIEYTGRNKPITGDIVFYNQNPYGHVGICVGDNWVIFEQNAVTGTGEGEANNCRIEIMSKANLVGWYRLKIN